MSRRSSISTCCTEADVSPLHQIQYNINPVAGDLLDAIEAFMEDQDHGLQIGDLYPIDEFHELAGGPRNPPYIPSEDDLSDNGGVEGDSDDEAVETVDTMANGNPPRRFGGR